MYEHVIAKPEKDTVKYIDATIKIIDAILADCEIVYVVGMDEDIKEIRKDL